MACHRIAVRQAPADLAKWLRRLIRNHILFEGAGSSPAVSFFSALQRTMCSRRWRASREAVSSTMPPTSLLRIASPSQPFSRPRLQRTVWTLQSEPGTLWTASIEMKGGTPAPMRESGNTVLALGSGSASETAKWLDEHRKHRAPHNPGLFSSLKGLKTRNTLPKRSDARLSHHGNRPLDYVQAK